MLTSSISSRHKVAVRVLLLDLHFFVQLKFKVECSSSLQYLACIPKIPSLPSLSHSIQYSWPEHERCGDCSSEQQALHTGVLLAE